MINPANRIHYRPEVGSQCRAAEGGWRPGAGQGSWLGGWPVAGEGIVKRERIEEGISQVQQDLAQADARLRQSETAAQRAWRAYLGGLAALLLGINLVVVLWPLGASLILAAVAAAAYGRIANRRALREMKETEEEIYRLKEELSRLQSLLAMA